MLNKELPMVLTPTEEEGIFLLTVGHTRDFFNWGFSKNDHVGDLTPQSPVIGTNGEMFLSNILILTYNTYTLNVGIHFQEKHSPNSAGTEVFCHAKTPEGVIETVTFYFDLNKFSSYSKDSLNWLPDVENQTIRIYLGPSPTPPQYF